MGRTSKPRKQYKAIWANVMPVNFGMQKETKDELAIAPLLALNMFMSGQGNEHIAYTIINSILLGYYLAKDDPQRKIIMEGSDSMKRVLVRGEDGRWGFSGDDLKGVSAAIILSDRLQSMASLREIRSALTTVMQQHCSE